MRGQRFSVEAYNPPPPPPSVPRETLWQIVEGNWVVKRAAGTTPAILGTKLKQHHFRGDNYMETDLEIGALVPPPCNRCWLALVLLGEFVLLAATCPAFYVAVDELALVIVLHPVGCSQVALRGLPLG